MHLMVDPTAEPIAHHTPVPVPLHWRDAVKAGLDHDVQLGVLEPVPVGEPVTWCHRMVVCAKKDGKPRRTVECWLSQRPHLSGGSPSYNVHHALGQVPLQDRALLLAMAIQGATMRS